MRKISISILLLLMVLLVYSPYLSANTIPQLINYNGTLADSNGTPVADGQYEVVFKIYDVPTGGAALWTETWNISTTKVIVTNGNFNAILGAHSPISASFFTDHPVSYLGVKVGTDSEMLPRQRMTSVGYAFTAGNGVPKGGVIMWSGAVVDIPEGWALCDGTNGTPDLRDRFIVGAGSGTGSTYIVGNKMPASGIPPFSYTVNLNHIHNIVSANIDHVHGDDHKHSGTTDYMRFPNWNDKRAPSYGDTTSAQATHLHDFTSNLKSQQGYGSTTGTMNSNVSHTHTENAQLSTSFDIRPPYYALAFIMKL